MELRKEIVYAALAAAGCAVGTLMVGMATPSTALAQAESECGGDCATECSCGCVVTAFDGPSCCSITYLG